MTRKIRPKEKKMKWKKKHFRSKRFPNKSYYHCIDASTQWAKNKKRRKIVCLFCNWMSWLPVKMLKMHVTTTEPELRFVWHFRDRNSAHNFMKAKQRPFGECTRRQRRWSCTHHMTSLFAECIVSVCVCAEAVCGQTVFNIDIETLTIITKIYLLPLHRISINFGVLIGGEKRAAQHFWGKCQIMVPFVG